MNDEEVFSLDGPDAPKVDGVDTLNDRVFDDYAKRFRGVDDAVLVVDYGSFSCKAGWSAEHNPRRTSLVVAACGRTRLLTRSLATVLFRSHTVKNKNPTGE